VVSSLSRPDRHRPAARAKWLAAQSLPFAGKLV
jgi:hypothetical protein